MQLELGRLALPKVPIRPRLLLLGWRPCSSRLDTYYLRLHHLGWLMADFAVVARRAHPLLEALEKTAVFVELSCPSGVAIVVPVDIHGFRLLGGIFENGRLLVVKDLT